MRKLPSVLFRLPGNHGQVISKDKAIFDPCLSKGDIITFGDEVYEVLSKKYEIKSNQIIYTVSNGAGM